MAPCAPPPPLRPLWDPVAATCGPVPANCGLDAVTCGPVAATYGPVAATCGPVAATCSPVAATCGPVAATSGPVAATCGPVAATCGPVATTCGPVAATCGPTATYGPVAATCGPFAVTSDQAAEQPSNRTAHLPSSRAAQQPSRPAAEPPSSRAALLPSRRAAELPYSRAAAVPTSAPRPSFLGLCDRADGLSLLDLTSGATPAPPATVDSTIRSQWATRDAAARLVMLFPATLTVDLLEKGLLGAEKSIVAVGASRGSLAPPSLRSVPPPPSCPLLPLLRRPTSLVSSRSVLRLPRAGDAAPARARGARALKRLAGAVEVVVEAVEGVGVVVGVVAGVEVSVAAVKAEEAAAVVKGAEAAEAAVAAEVVEAAAAAVDLVAALRRGVAPVVVRASSSRALVRPYPLSSFVSGTLRVSAVGVRVPAPTFSAPATALVSSAGARTPPSAASAA
ncbi:unnamed protein product [Closterium sp. NIES-65]|nr:unnamed protein product [Closterium sp. NIES-65]